MLKTAKLLRTILALAVMSLAAVATFQVAPAVAQSEHTSVLRISSVAKLPAKRNVKIGLNKSMVVELPRDVRDVLASDPKILDIVLNTSRRAYLIGTGIGQANAFFFDQSGNRILSLEVVVDRDPAPLENLLNRLIPNGKIKVEFLNDTVILTGKVPNASDATRASDIAARFVVTQSPESNVKYREKVINLLVAESKEQVLLKVSVVEMERTMIKQLGVDFSNLAGTAGATFMTGNFSFSSLSNLQFPFNGKDVVSTIFSSAGFKSDSADVNAVITALEQNGLVRTLAEPTLTAISGETANFLAGGEFPIPIAQDNDTISMEFKPFGVGLSFTPLVLTEGRISMKVSTEVSELTNEGAITLGIITVPGLKVRRANTTIELPSGGSLVIAGLISDETKQAMTGQPGLKNLPVL
ncbi:MAG: type II and III secretion system protein family protein, partial [Hyphomicrobiaceae bacterium]|nr:type II and III secretion system protein family protein [Hyphomicrobiaceae bacterium]